MLELNNGKKALPAFDEAGASTLIKRNGYRFQFDLAAARHQIAKSGQIKTVLAVTLAACFASVCLSALLWGSLFHQALTLTSLLISFIVPALIFPIGFWYLVAVTLDLHQLESEMRYLASYDELTDVMTRRAFFSGCEQLHALMQRQGKPFAMAYIDLDDFKSVNDQYGHTAGDEVLRSFAQLLSEQVRRSDLVGRIGGEEFALALPETDLHGARHLLNEIRILAKQTMVEYGDEHIQITISIGLTYSDTGNRQNLNELIQQADQALYIAKNGGKDRLVQHHCQFQPA